MQIIRFGFRLAYRVSKADQWPTWYDGQPFKAIREELIKKEDENSTDQFKKD